MAPHLGRVDGGLGCEPPQPPGTDAWRCGALAAGIVATIGANLAHGLGHGPVGAMVSAWPALALVGSFELLMLLIRKHHLAGAGQGTGAASDVARPGSASATRGAAGAQRWTSRCGTCMLQATASGR